MNFESITTKNSHKLLVFTERNSVKTTIETTISFLEINFDNNTTKTIKVIGDFLLVDKNYFILNNCAENTYDFFDIDCKLVYQTKKTSGKTNPLYLKLQINHFKNLRSMDLLEENRKFQLKINRT